MVRRIGSFVAMLLIATLVLAACGSEDDEVEPTVTRVDAAGAPEPTVPGQETPTAAAAAGSQSTEEAGAGGETAGGAVTIDVEMVDIAFNPAEITVPANTDVTVNLVNNGVGGHTFTIEALGVDSGIIAGGQTGTVTFNSGAPAEYEFICTVPGHKEAGMVGKLIVTDEAATGGGATADASPAASGASPVAQPPAEGGASAAPSTVDVELVDIAFEPTEIRVPANTEITVNLTNGGVGSHTFTIDDLGVDSGQIAGGQTGTVTFNSGAPGTYEYYCTVPGHKEAGMVGTLIVE